MVFSTETVLVVPSYCSNFWHGDKCGFCIKLTNLC